MEKIPDDAMTNTLRYDFPGSSAHESSDRWKIKSRIMTQINNEYIFSAFKAGGLDSSSTSLQKLEWI